MAQNKIMLDILNITNYFSGIEFRIIIDLALSVSLHKYLAKQKTIGFNIA